MGERLKDPKKGFACLYSDCKASFSKAWKLEAHYCRHTGVRPFACDNCTKGFCTRFQLRRHQLSHSGETPYLCSVETCAQAFSTITRMKNHIARVHEHKHKIYVCNYEGCNKEFCKKKQLKTHQCDHANQLPYECKFEDCGKKCATSQSLKKHGKVHNEILQCGDCKKVFHDAWFLMKHKQFVHSGERRLYKCTKEGCQKTYTTHFNLQNHILSYHDGKCPFICSHAGCGKAFSMEESLKRHGVVHDPKKKKLQKKSNQKKKNLKNLPSKAKVSDASALAARLKKVSLNKSPSQNKPSP